MQNFISAPAERKQSARQANSPAGREKAAGDTRPLAAQLRTLQAMMGASPQQQAHQDMQATMRRGGVVGPVPAQLKMIAGLSKGAASAVANKVHFKDGEKEVDRLWLMPEIIRDTRAGLLSAIALEAGQLGAEIDDAAAVSGWTWNSDGSKSDTINPLRVRFPAQYGLAGARHAMSLDYHFGPNWSGYVIHVSDAGKQLDHKMQGDKDVDLADDEYSAIHDTDLAGGALAGADSADAVTKVAGEGARWRCIGANAGILRDVTKIYTNENAGNTLTDSVRYISFPTLWKSWAETFDKSYAISDATVVSKLKAAEVQTKTMAGKTPVAVSVAPSHEMNIGRDISVDAVKPAAQAELAPKTVSFLHIAKKKSVVDSINSLANETAAARQAIEGCAGLTYRNMGGYVGNRTFAFLCDVTPAMNLGALADYTAVDDGHAGFSYPTYREPSAGPYAAKHAKAVNISKATAIYALEKLNAYNDYVKEIVEEIEAYEFDSASGLDLTELVKSVMVPWPDQTQAIPARCHTGARDAMDDPEAFYRTMVDNRAAAVLQQRKDEFKAAVRKGIEAHKYFESKSRSEQNTIRSQVQSAVLAQFGGELADYTD